MRSGRRLLVPSLLRRRLPLLPIALPLKMLAPVHLFLSLKFVRLHPPFLVLHVRATQGGRQIALLCELAVSVPMRRT